MNFYFFTVFHGSPEDAGYEHCIVSLAEGLRLLGHEVYGNTNYWPIGNSWLIKKCDKNVEDFDALIISNEWLHKYGKLPAEYVKAQKPRKVYIDASDGWKTEAIIDHTWPADIVLRTHFIKNHWYHKRVKPWAFGLTHRIIEAFNYAPPLSERKKSILCNFRVGHPARDHFTAKFKTVAPSDYILDTTIDTTIPQEPKDKLYWQLTGRRHYPLFFDRLKQARICLAFGGYFAPSYQYATNTLLGRIHYKAIQKLKLSTHTVGQFDSWRFWESLASGAITVHVNFNDYHCVLPVQPNEEIDYLAFSERFTKVDIKRYIDSLLLNNIGRHWALKYYSPEAVAERFLEWIF